MNRRQLYIDRIQALSVEEGTRQPTAAAWLDAQDRKQRAARRPVLEGAMRRSAVMGRYPLLDL